eukprot:6815390-Prymnesium_polylepis.1
MSSPRPPRVALTAPSLLGPRSPRAYTDNRKLIELEKDSSKRLQKLLTMANDDIHPDQKFLVPLLENQMAVL